MIKWSRALYMITWNKNFVINEMNNTKKKNEKRNEQYKINSAGNVYAIEPNFIRSF